MSEEDLKACMQCAQLRETLQPCEGGCGREICSFCGTKCKECCDNEIYDQIRQEKEEKKQEEKEAKKPKWEPERTTGEKVERAMDWVFGLSGGALRRELEYYEGEFDMYDEKDIQEMMRERWKGLPDWKKKLYKVKKDTEMFVAKTVLKAGIKGGRIIGEMGFTGRRDYDDDYDDDDGKYF
jgi:hypothetical protein